MPEKRIQAGFTEINNARIYYETAGEGQPFVMLHAGVADSRQWNNEFTSFSENYHAVRYDLRGYGQSLPIKGEYSHLQDLTALLDYLHIEQPLIVMGCSMGGGLAMNFALTHHGQVKALIMVDSGPPGLDLDVPEPEEFKEVEKAFDAGDLDRVAELETQIWFDGVGRTPDQVDQPMRRLLYEMNRNALSHEAKKLGKRLPDRQVKAADHLGELDMPVLVIVGSNDLPYMHAAADYMLANIPTALKVVIPDAAHLPNMEHPDTFQQVVEKFLDSVLESR
jgi:pimeloyl-ACP methyl ester carboxylesterase